MIKSGAMRILLATTNQGKVAELRQIMSGKGVELIGLSESETTEPIETGETFSENALLKANHYYRKTGLPTIADDSGLEVEALNGAPGVHSARYAGEGADDGARVSKLLEEMKDVPTQRRCARFVCAAAIVWDGGEKVVLDEARGVILQKPRGHNGFGYDPVFLYEPLDKSFAELAASEKAEVSHRGRAFRRLAAWLGESGLLDTPSSTDRIVTTAD
ncbi:MAG TPA: RdgB/HAM1 family non-canonical purine NTP pyrophosphatase [Blastocatellia bacterium]|nr:RdgB/HAM1 family non-canonical purine NTP pyrophosphatase [Blastocatellia bacterium]